MLKLYMIAYDEKLKRDEITAFLSVAKGCEQWFYSIPNSLFVYSSLTADDLYDCVVRRFPNHGRFFVTEVPRNNSQGWIPNNHCEIIRKHIAVHNYTLDFQGYWLEDKECLLPAGSGIYCVYASTHDLAKDTVSLREVLYIGKSDNVRRRHVDHEGKTYWKRRLRPGEILSYSFAPLSGRSLTICELALIYKLQPPCNDMGKESFMHEPTHVITKGRNACLPMEFTVSDGK